VRTPAHSQPDNPERPILMSTAGWPFDTARARARGIPPSLVTSGSGPAGNAQLCVRCGDCPSIGTATPATEPSFGAVRRSPLRRDRHSRAGSRARSREAARAPGTAGCVRRRPGVLSHCTGPVSPRVLGRGSGQGQSACRIGRATWCVLRDRAGGASRGLLSRSVSPFSADGGPVPEAVRLPRRSGNSRSR
jgi:hypothetical protein